MFFDACDSQGFRLWLEPKDCTNAGAGIYNTIVNWQLNTVLKWQRRLKKLFGLAGVDGGHAHRFRDYSASGTIAE